jgi:hypothetical protein
MCRNIRTLFNFEPRNAERFGPRPADGPAPEFP